MAKIQVDKYYSDLDLSLKVHPLTGDLVPKYNVDAIKRSVKHLFSLSPYDIPFRPELRTKMREYLFDPADHLTESAIRSTIEFGFKRIEPRANLKEIDIKLREDGRAYEITVWFNIKSLQLVDSFTFIASRVR